MSVRAWAGRRRKPYTAIGTCGARFACDVALNRAVLRFMRHPDIARQMKIYEAEASLRMIVDSA